MHLPTKWELGLLGVIAAHVLLVPYTKVEESFNLQATHDVLFHNIDLAAYDHNNFPGVVPRTFIGAGLVAALALPMFVAQQLLQLPKLTMLYSVRLILGATCWAAMCRVCCVLSVKLGKPCGRAFLLITALQFHLPFYMSRTLPNTFATAVLGFAIADWIDAHHPRRLIALLAFATVVFRCDMLPLAALIGLHMLSMKQISLLSGVLTGLVAASASVCLTVGVDSWFWQRWLWPEGEVLWFNTAQNRSSEWGVMPFHWYFTSALPRSLLGTLPMVFLGGLLERRIRPFVLITAAYILLYSFLPHKEVRFLLPVVPVFNTASAAALARIWTNRHKAAWRVAWAASLLLLAATLFATTVMVSVSSHNYPGGHALHQLHELHLAGQAGGQQMLQRAGQQAAAPVKVHIDVLPAMTGVSRFGELDPPWQYSKAEDLLPEELQQQGFTYLLSGNPNVTGFTPILGVEGYQKVHVLHSFKQMSQAVTSGQLLLRIECLAKVFVLKSNSMQSTQL